MHEFEDQINETEFKKSIKLCSKKNTEPVVNSFRLGKLISTVVLSQLFCKSESDIVAVKEVGEPVCGLIPVDGSVLHHPQELPVRIRVGPVENDFLHHAVVVLPHV